MKAPFRLGITIIQTVKNTYKSNLDEQELLLLEAFLLTFAKLDGFKKYNGNDYKQDLESLVKNSSNTELIKLFEENINPICQKARKLFLDNFATSINKLHQASDGGKYLNYFDDLLRNHFEKYSFGETAQSVEITRLMNSFMPEKENLSYYNPFAGLASLALNLPQNISYYGEEFNDLTWLLGRMRMLIYKCPSHFQLQKLNSIENWHFTSQNVYDFIAFNPPFNLRLDESFPHFLNEKQFGDHRNANTLIVAQTFKKLKEDGKMVFLMPGSFLFNNKPKDKAFRKYLTDNNYIDSIISLPTKIFRTTSIPVNIIVLTKNNSKKRVRFVDGSEFFKKLDGKFNKIDLQKLLLEINSQNNTEYSSKIETDAIKAQDYNLSVNRYVFENPEFPQEWKDEHIALSNVISPIPLERTKAKTGKLVTVTDLSKDKFNFILDLKTLEEKELKNSFPVIREKVLIVNLLTNNLKPTLIDPANDEFYIVSPPLQAFYVDEKKIIPQYLSLEFDKEYVKTQLKRFSNHTILSRISIPDFLSTHIILPSLQEQQNQLNKAFYDFQIYKQNEVKEIALNYNIDVADENSFLRHQIAGPLRNLRKNFKSVMSILDDQVLHKFPDLLSLKLNDKLHTSMRDYLARIDRDLQSITKAANTTGDQIDLTDVHRERIDFIKFVNEYKIELESNNGGRYTVEIDIDPLALEENKLKTIYIDGDKDLIRKMFDNIVENADKHAFEKKINAQNRLKFEFLYNFEDSEVQLDITNTGNTLPEDYSHEEFIRKGDSTGVNAGDGTGGWFINEVMKIHNGKFGFTDETGPEGLGGDFVTSIELYFPIQLK